MTTSQMKQLDIETKEIVEVLRDPALAHTRPHVAKKIKQLKLNDSGPKERKYLWLLGGMVIGGLLF